MMSHTFHSINTVTRTTTGFLVILEALERLNKHLEPLVVVASCCCIAEKYAWSVRSFCYIKHTLQTGLQAYSIDMTTISVKAKKFMVAYF